MTKACVTIAIIGVFSLVAACTGGSSTDTAHVRIVHVSPGTDGLNVTFDSATAASSLNYHGATSYQNIGAGIPEFKVTLAVTGATFVDMTVTLSANTHYTFVVYGGGNSVSAAALTDDVSDASSGKFQMRISHAATGIGSLDIYLLAPGTTIAQTTPAYSGMGYAANTNFISYSSGDYNIVIAPAGSKEIIYDSGKQTLSGNSKLTLLIFASGSAKLANATLLLDDGSGTTTFLDNIYSRFKFMNGGADLGTADVLIDGSLTLSGIPYGSLSGYDTVKSGARNLQIQASSSPGNYLYNQTQSLSAAGDYSLVAYSVNGMGGLSLFALQDNNLPLSGKAKLRFVNASSDSTAYDAYVNYTKLLTGIVPASGSKYQELDSGTSFVLSFNTSGTGAQAVTLAGQELDAAHVYTAYVYGRNGQAAAALVKDN